MMFTRNRTGWKILQIALTHYENSVPSPHQNGKCINSSRNLFEQGDGVEKGGTGSDRGAYYLNVICR